MSWMSFLEPTPAMMVMLLAAMIGLVVTNRVLVAKRGKGHEIEKPSATASEVTSVAE